MVGVGTRCVIGMHQHEEFREVLLNMFLDSSPEVPNLLDLTATKAATKANAAHTISPTRSLI